MAMAMQRYDAMRRSILQILFFVILLAHRYADTQIGVPAFSPLMHASSLSYP